MPVGFSKQDLELLGYSDVHEIEELSAHGRPWQFYKASAVAGVRTVTHTFLYVHSACSQENAIELSKRVKPSDDLFLITPRSGISVENLRKIFGNGANVSILEDLIWEKLNSLFTDYVQSLKEGIIKEEYYVTPRSEDSIGPKDRLDDKVLEYLLGKSDVGCINVVSASAGVGKTTLARHVVLKLAEQYERQRRIPTFVEASHWGKLQLESVDDLWEIISNSLANFSPGLAITEALFKHALSQGYLVFIFDGFDELCTQRYSRFSARDVLNWLIEIARETEARIVITTRTLFWDAEVGDIPKCTVLRKLRPFEAPQARDYFNKYFKKDDKSAERALTLYSRLIEQSQRPRQQGGGRVQFANLPICVGIIARYVREGGETLDVSGQGTIIEQFLIQILERERARQRLLTTAKDQLRALEEIAVNSVDLRHPEFELELLSAAGFSDADIPKLNVHPLLMPAGDSLYRFGYAFLESYLLASYLARMILDIDKEKNAVWPVMEREASGNGYVVEHLVELLGTNAEAKLSDFYRRVPADKPLAKSFLFHVAKALIDENANIVTGQEKSHAIFSILRGGELPYENVVRNLTIVGNIDRLDLSNIAFFHCVFRDTHFIKCRANENTTFSNCVFSGDLIFDDCKPAVWASVKIENCKMEPPTPLVWEGLIGKPLTTDEDHVVDAMHIALSKFWQHGRFKGSIRREDWKKGTLGHSIYCQTILDAMLRTGVLMRAQISGVAEGGYAFNREVLQELQLFMDNRQLTGKLRLVYQELKS